MLHDIEPDFDFSAQGLSLPWLPTALARFVTDENLDKLERVYCSIPPLPDFRWSEKTETGKTEIGKIWYRRTIHIRDIQIIGDHECTATAFRIAESIICEKAAAVAAAKADPEADRADREIIDRFYKRYAHWPDGDYDNEKRLKDAATARMAERRKAWTDEEREKKIQDMACRVSRFLKKHSRRRFELLALALGRTGEKTGRAVSDYSSIRMTYARENARTWEETHQIRTHDDRVFKLSDIHDKKTRCEAARVYSWLKGLEKFARKKKHGSLVPCFITLTAPPEFHPNPSNDHNSWDYSTPTAGQEWLTDEWAKLRARLAKINITLSGFRVSESHKDGCAHLHYLVYVSAEQRTAICKAISYKWRIVKNKKGKKNSKADLEDFRKRSGTQEANAQVKWLDDRSESEKRKASASTYVMKYVMKTLHAKPEEEDRERSWRQVWGIRNYQFFGVTTKNVWEALRHKDAKAEAGDTLTSKAIYYARTGDFCSLLEIDGKIGIKDKDRIFSIDIDDESDPDKKTIFICRRVDEAVFHVLEFFKYRATIESVDSNGKGKNEGKNQNQNQNQSYSYSKVTQGKPDQNQKPENQPEDLEFPNGFDVGWSIVCDKNGISYIPPDLHPEDFTNFLKSVGFACL